MIDLGALWWAAAGTGQGPDCILLPRCDDGAVWSMEELREVAVHMRTISVKGVAPDATCGLRRCLRTADSGHCGEFERFDFGMFEGVEVGMSMQDRQNTAGLQRLAYSWGRRFDIFEVSSGMLHRTSILQASSPMLNEDSSMDRCMMHINEITLIGQL